MAATAFRVVVLGICTMVLCATPGRLLADPTTSGTVHLLARAERDHLLPYEPLCLELTLWNSGATSATVSEFWAYYLSVSERPVGGTEWKSLPTWWLPQAAPLPLSPLSVRAGERLSATWQGLTFDAKGQLALFAGQRYEIRVEAVAGYRPLGASAYQTLVAAPVLLTITEPEGSEIAAIQGLQQTPGLLRCLLPSSAQSVSEGRDKPGVLSEFIEAHPASVYSMYLRATYVNIFRPGAWNDGRPPELAARYRAEVRQHDAWLLDPRAEEMETQVREAAEEAADPVLRAQRQQERIEKARQDLRRLIQSRGGDSPSTAKGIGVDRTGSELVPDRAQ